MQTGEYFGAAFVTTRVPNLVLVGPLAKEIAKNRPGHQGEKRSDIPQQDKRVNHNPKKNRLCHEQCCEGSELIGAITPLSISSW